MIVCLVRILKIQIRSSRQKRLSSNWQLLIKQGMIIGKIIKEIRKYGWTIWERVIMFQLPSGLRRTFLNTRECKYRKETKGVGFFDCRSWKGTENGSYEYAVLPQTNETLMKKFAKKPTYKVLQQDRNAHIVESVSEQIISYVLFETPETTLPGGLLQRVDTSCLVMIHKGSADKIKLTVAQPDLALYRGPSDEAFDKDGKRIERSIYSRPWIENASSEIPVTVTIKGQWNVEETPFCKVISSDKKQTVLQFSCKDGASFEVELRR